RLRGACQRAPAQGAAATNPRSDAPVANLGCAPQLFVAKMTNAELSRPPLVTVPRRSNLEVDLCEQSLAEPCWHSWLSYVSGRQRDAARTTFQTRKPAALRHPERRPPNGARTTPPTRRCWLHSRDSGRIAWKRCGIFSRRATRRI